MSARAAANALRVCPVCGIKGQTWRNVVVVRERGIERKRLIVAVLTLGLALLIPGMALSRRRKAILTHCGACEQTWEI